MTQVTQVRTPAARVGFALLAVFLGVLALPPTRESAILFPAILVFGVGLVLVARADGPPAARYAALLFGGYIALVLLLFVAATPFTIGKHWIFVNGDPSPLAMRAFDLAVSALPVVLALGAGATAWPWSGWTGRGAAAVGLVLVAAFLVVSWMSEPQSFDAAALAGAARLARIADVLLSLAAAALFVAAALLAVPARRALAPPRSTGAK